jgi:Effector-associated domain 11
MRYIIPTFVIGLSLLLWMASMIRPAKIRLNGTVTARCAEYSVTSSTVILFECDGNKYFFSDTARILNTLIGKTVAFSMDTNRIHTISPDSIIVGNSIYYSVGEKPRVNYKPTDNGVFVIGWVQFLIALFSSVISIALWQIQTSKAESLALESEIHCRKPHEDYGIFYISTALLLWGIIGLIRIYNQDSPCLNVTNLALSAINNFFFLFSFSHFIYGIRWINANKGRYQLIVLGIFITNLTAVFLLENKVNIPFVSIAFAGEMANWIDLFITSTTLTILAYLLINSFWNRGLRPIAWLSGLWSISAIVGQLGGISPGLVSAMGSYWNVNYLVSCIVLNVLITALMFSWYTDENKALVEAEAIEKNILENLEKTKNSNDLNVQLKDLIQRDRIKLVLKAVDRKAKTADSPFAKFQNDIVMLSNQLAQYQANLRMNVVSAEKLKIEYNCIVFALNGLIDEMFQE